MNDSNYRKDYNESQKLHKKLLDFFVSKQFTYNAFDNSVTSPIISCKTTTSYSTDHKGIDITFTDSDSALIFTDEKASIYYRLQTNPLKKFAFELGYIKNGEYKIGWLINEEKVTQYYCLVWPHFNTSLNDYDVAEIMFIKRKPILQFVETIYPNLIQDILKNQADVWKLDKDGIRNKYEIAKNSVTKDTFKEIVNSEILQRFEDLETFKYFENPANDPAFLCLSSKLNEKPLNCVISKPILYALCDSDYYYDFKNKYAYKLDDNHLKEGVKMSFEKISKLLVNMKSSENSLNP